MTSNIFRRHFDLLFVRLCATFTTTTLVNLPYASCFPHAPNFYLMAKDTDGAEHPGLDQP